MDIHASYEQWLRDFAQDEDTVEDLQAIAGDEKEIKSATGVLIKRVVAAVAVFLLFLIVSVVTGWVGGQEWKDCWNAAGKDTVEINPLG